MWTALRFTFITFILSGLLYPLLMTGLAQLLFPLQANGSLVHDQKGVVIGSLLIGQSFTRPEYFHPRPSANGYDGANSGGYNQGATNQKLLSRVQVAAKNYRQQTGAEVQWVPVDAVTASGSGLDPHISLANAKGQAVRVAHARHLNGRQVEHLIAQYTEQSPFGEGPYVNVFRLNLALDQVTSGAK